MSLDADQLWQITELIWSTTLGFDLQEDDDAGEEPSCYLVGTVRIAGRQGVRVVLECDRRLAREAAAVMLGEPGEGLDELDLADAVGELTNMIAGQIKDLLPAPARLSLPVVAGGTPAGEEPAPGPVFRVRFHSHGRPLRVTAGLR